MQRIFKRLAIFNLSGISLTKNLLNQYCLGVLGRDMLPMLPKSTGLIEEVDINGWFADH
jgi:hypothetical protein